MDKAETRPSKKQRELLSFIDGFIKGNGYGPSYREIMRALDYKSVSTVAVHVDGLIARGLLNKKDNSARSLEVVAAMTAKSPRDAHIEWLERELEKRKNGGLEADKKEVAVLEQALKILQKN
jgi:repressor LexA